MKMKIMIIDDDLYMADVIARFLKRSSFETVIYSVMSDGLRRIMEERVDGIILDLHMPGMNAIEAVPIIREINPDAFVGIVTSDSSAEARYSAIKGGADFFLEKPNEILHILDAIEAYQCKRAV